ncbi:glutathione S-transferase family protein [Methylopila sp. M107]|uniref:glutathione S-transferase family protein n=1 Tax=Methylopila sp. M107 TaxID=1101190 RepID=UPI00037F4A2C|nr:glutathione S-transferase family protein [Methylopila sp. M107]
MTARFALHHHPRSRAQRIKWLLEETGAPYELVHHDLEAGTHKTPEFLKLNPDGKIPTLIDRGPDGKSEVVVTESAAILIHVADCYPEAGLAPTPGSVERGPYLTWIAYASAAIEPAFADVMFPRAEPAPPVAIGWPTFDAALARVAAGFEPGPWLLGERFTAADLMVGSLLGWLNSWGKLPDPERFAGLFERIAARPAHQRTFGR